MSPSVLVIIPARGGSKGIPKKNIYPVNGKPLMVYSIEAALGCPAVTKTVVSSDSPEILAVAEQAGAEPLRRPDELATDAASSMPVVTHAVKHYAAAGETFDILCLLQATSPLRNVADLTRAFDEYFQAKATASISVYEPNHPPFKSFKLKSDGFMEGLVDNVTPFMRRQDLPKTFIPNGAIYIVDRKMFMENEQLFTDRTLPFIMPESRSIDIDTPQDLKLLEQLLGRST